MVEEEEQEAVCQSITAESDCRPTFEMHHDTVNMLRHLGHLGLRIGIASCVAT